jgi:UDP-N-acetylglucosamine 2-epimerase (non-hydrolysing)
LLGSYGLEQDRYILATVHRPENTDDGERLAAVLTELAALPLPVVFPAHPRTRAAAERHGLVAKLERLRPIAPLGYRAFLGLAAHARLLVSDSGGLQEECTVLKKPLIVVRNSTERPEAFESGFAFMAQAGPAIGRMARMLLADQELAERLAGTPSPFGDGRASERIADLVGGPRAGAMADSVSGSGVGIAVMAA